MARVPAYVRAAEEQESAARDLYHERKRAYEIEFRTREDAARTRIIADLKDQHEAVEQARACARVAEEVLDSERIRASQESEEGHRVGTIMAEWDHARYYGLSTPRDRKLKLTGRRGRIEVWTGRSDAPHGTRWSCPNVGEKYVRLFKKDGTDSRKFEKLNGWKGEWFPEGVTPDGAR